MKFAGDALLVLWRSPQNNTEEERIFDFWRCCDLRTMGGFTKLLWFKVRVLKYFAKKVMMKWKNQWVLSKDSSKRTFINNMLILIQGAYGAGKSHFIRHLIEKIYKHVDLMSWYYSERTHLLISSLNFSNKGGVVNSWRNVSAENFNDIFKENKKHTKTAIIKIISSSVSPLFIVFDCRTVIIYLGP